MYKNDNKIAIKYYTEYTDKFGKKHYTVNIYKHADKTIENQFNINKKAN